MIGHVFLANSRHHLSTNLREEGTGRTIDRRIGDFAIVSAPFGTCKLFMMTQLISSFPNDLFRFQWTHFWVCSRP